MVNKIKFNKDVNRMQQDYNQLFKNNKNWVEEKLAENPEYFKKLAEGQTPKYLYIGCSDSRVPANEITGTGPGELFIHRNIANVVNNTDLNLLSVVQYAVEVLKVEHILVCGHYGCGGVKAALDGNQNGLIDNWLSNIKNVYRLHRAELDDIDNEHKKLKRLVELNVIEGMNNLAKTDIIQKAWKNNQPLQLHAWVIDIETGLINDLNNEVKRDFKDYELFELNLK